MRYPDVIKGGFWLILGIVLSLWSTNYEIGTVMQPGPGFLPLILGLLLIFLSIVLLGQARKASQGVGRPPITFQPGGWKRVFFTAVILILAGFLFERMGYILTVFLLMICLMWRVGGLHWKRVFAIAFLTTLGVYIVFILLLDQPFPRGFLGI